MKYDVREIIKMVYQDIGFEDITTKALIPPDKLIKAKIISREKGILSGIDLVDNIFQEFSINTTIKKHDGEKLAEDDIIMEIDGDASTILSVERTVLNILMRMSGISTITAMLIEKVNNNVIIAGTRKTTPGLQFLEKEAIRVGGGDTHRFRLDDCILIKDNHIAIVGSVKEAVEMAKGYVSFTKKVEVEVESTKDALEAAMAGVDIIMLDNMNPDEIRNVLNALENKGLRNKILIEVSGGINPDNIVDYVKTGVDVISTGYITHSAKSLDMSLEII
ncbi:carboxylating nicotinate-nucleotide diphosphorylase [Methanobacterium spitsbergense]|uniref:Nicotinate-nucleotide pyrophosphorylase [carboxylating] n=1 Tax=Methanobacterium spitsbergense TaxID=2874285 RepID=A0A8T5UQP6_9EURY|nr:carboxylating nicotinate-nucleotide diphosphorylase [Methanobacterium spitsbergense]MBZ2166088.1 carboxylating nicotinate-nucleotide diphosphorylase [Methanobacterium spitsbergense]